MRHDIIYIVVVVGAEIRLFSSKETLCLLLLQEVVGYWIHSMLTVGSYTAL